MQSEMDVLIFVHTLKLLIIPFVKLFSLPSKYEWWSVSSRFNKKNSTWFCWKILVGNYNVKKYLYCCMKNVALLEKHC